MSKSLRFTVSESINDKNQPIQEGVFSRDWKGEEPMDHLMEQLQIGQISEEQALISGRHLLEAAPLNLELQNFVAGRLWRLDLRDEAAAMWGSAYELGASKIPKSFSGRIQWWELDNRPFLRCAYGHVLGLAHRGRHRQSLALAKKIMRWCPNDNLGVRYLIPDLQFASGDLNAALKSYLREVPEQPTLWYNAGLIAYRQGDYVKACTYLRRGIAGNPYVAEGLTGRIEISDHIYWHESNLHGTDFALDYLNMPSINWGDEERDFMDWLFNCSAVLMERAALTECHEGLTYERDIEKRARIGKRKMQLQEAIDDRTSVNLVQKVENRWGDQVWPWDRLGMRHPAKAIEASKQKRTDVL